MGWGSFSDAFSSVSNAVQKVTTPVANLAEKVGSNKALNTALPLTALYTGQGRENLVNGVWGKFGKTVASVYTGGKSDGVANAIEQQVNGSGGTADPGSGPGGFTSPSGSISDLVSALQNMNASAGSGLAQVPFAPAANSSKTWIIIAAIGAGVVLFLGVIFMGARRG